jgi:predicted Rossmann fold flavoprotein
LNRLPQNTFDAIIIGAGAAGMFCAAQAGKRGKRVLLLDHAETAGEKIRISGGGRCNFTNLRAGPQNFISENPHFCKSALKGYTQHDFIRLIEKHGIAWHEKTLGQLFCDRSAQQVIDMLLAEMDDGGVTLSLETAVRRIERADGGFAVETARGDAFAEKLVIATGGLSIPKIGATGFGYDVARQFGHGIVPTRAALVPLTFDPALLAETKALAGVAVDPASVACGRTDFREALLFTHRGLSGPAILQISTFWDEAMPVAVNLLPDADLYAALRDRRQPQARQLLHTVLGEFIPRRLAEAVVAGLGLHEARMGDLPDQKLKTVAARVQDWRVVPVGSEGYRTAEVTRGGVDTRGLSSKTMESEKQPGLYFIGEVVDVTGWLGGYNFQWAWSSAHAAAQAL